MKSKYELNEKVRLEVEERFKNIIHSTEREPQAGFDRLFGRLPSLFIFNKNLMIAHSHLIRLIKEYSKSSGKKYLIPTGYLSYRSETLGLTEADFSKIDLVSRFIKAVFIHEDYSSFLESFQLSAGIFLFNLVLFSRVLCKKHLNAINLDLKHTYVGHFGVFTNIRFKAKYTNSSSKFIEDRYYHNPFSYPLLKHITERFPNMEFKKADYSNFFREFSSDLGYSEITLDLFVRYSSISFKLMEEINVSEFIDETLRNKNRLVPLSNEFYQRVGEDVKNTHSPAIVGKSIKGRIGISKSSTDKFYKEVKQSKKAIASVLTSGDTKKSILNQLKMLAPNVKYPIARYLLLWYVKKLEVDKLKLKSVSDYHSRIFQRLCEQFRYSEPSELSRVDFGLCLANVIPDAGKEKTKDDIRDTLAGFYAFLKYKTNPPELLDEHIFSKTGRIHVSAKYISGALYRAVLSSVKSSELGAHQKSCHLLIAILAYRTGARLSEIIGLELNDICILGSSIKLCVRSNSRRSLKSKNSRRTLYLNILLNSEELRLFQSIYNNIDSTASSESAPLFAHTEGGGNPLEAPSVGVFFSDLLFSLSGLNYTFHSFRHTALSNMFLCFEGLEDELCEISDYDKQHCNEVNSFFCSQGPRERKYWELAKFAGHSNPKTSMESYIHFAREVSNSAMIKSGIKIPTDYVRAISGMSFQRINRTVAEKVNKKELSAYSIVCKEFLLSLNNSIPSCYSKPSKEKRSNVLNECFPKEVSLGFHAFLNLLSDIYSSNNSIDEISNNYGVSSEDIQKYQENLRLISLLKTQKGKFRFKARTGAEHVLPKINSRNDRDDLTFLDQAFSESMTKFEGLCKSNLMYFLANSTSTASDLVFKKKSELKAFLKPFREYEIHKRFLLRIQIPSTYTPGRVLDYWKSLTGRVEPHPKSVKAANFKHGKGHLTLLAKSNATLGGRNNYKKMTSSAFRLFFMVAAVRYLEPSDIKSLSNSNG